jgi:ribulose-phosphate 3-epimerase
MPSNNSEYELYVSVISANPRLFLDNLGHLESLGIDGIHFDVMDGSFVPRLGLYPEFLKEIRSISSLPIEVHMMMENPESFIEDFVEVGATSIIPHVESLTQVSRVISKIKDSGAQAGVALNPGTHLGLLEEIVSRLDTVVLMAINPGIVGHVFIDETFNKAIRLSRLLTKLNENPTIEIDGGVNFTNAKRIIASGEGRRVRLVCGAGTIFHRDGSMKQNMTRLVESLSD